MFKSIISKRRIVQGIFGLSLYFIISYFKINLLHVLLFGSLTGIIFGKVFCRWMCPLGFIMELFMGGDPDNNKVKLYNYHKLGCPIAWVGGFFNRFSLFKINRNENLCVDCGKCDSACYISSLNKEYSLFKNKKESPSSHYSCSKCLQCVEDCPTNSLTYEIGIKIPTENTTIK